MDDTEREHVTADKGREPDMTAACHADPRADTHDCDCFIIHQISPEK